MTGSSILLAEGAVSEDAMALSKKRRQTLTLKVGEAFSPAAPIDRWSLFAGRIEQVAQVVGAINRKGQHAIVFGERGVGKTSLANILSDVLHSEGVQALACRVNCDGTDDYSSVWRKVMGEARFASRVKEAGFVEAFRTEAHSLAELLPEKVTPHDVRKVLEAIGAHEAPIIIIDEFDKLKDGDASSLFADTIKALSDYAVNAALILVGVADTVDELIREHLSIERALVQVRMPRMSREELHEIVDKGLSSVGMSIEPDALRYISTLSQGLPHYTHLVGLYAARRAIGSGHLMVSAHHVEEAIADAIGQAQQTIQSAFHKATMSPRKENLYRQVLLASALAKADDFGYFAAADVRQPMTRIMGRPFEIPAFSRHLNDLCEARRGPVLQKIGAAHRFRFRFVNPLMQPFVIMTGLSCGMIDAALVQELGR